MLPSKCNVAEIFARNEIEENLEVKQDSCMRARIEGYL